MTGAEEVVKFVTDSQLPSMQYVHPAPQNTLKWFSRYGNLKPWLTASIKTPSNLPTIDWVLLGSGESKKG